MKMIQRRYMEAIREMSQTREPFSVESIRIKHRTSHMATTMKSLRWVNRAGSKTVWVGPRPKSEAELLRMATTLISAMEPTWKRTKPVQKKREFSILWGLFKWQR